MTPSEAAPFEDPELRERLLNSATAYLASSRRAGTAIQVSAEDIVQHALTLAWEKRSEFEPGRVLSAWVCGFIANLIRGYRRDANRQPVGIDASEIAGHARPIADSVADRLDVQALMVRLSPPGRELVRLRYAEGRSAADVAAELGITEVNVRTRGGRLLAKLREEVMS